MITNHLADLHYYNQGLNAVDTLRVIVDQLVSISSIVVVNVRDVVTEAAMTIGHEIAVALADLRSKIQIANRQLNAESSKASSKTSKKSLAVSKEKDISDKLLTSLTALLENIFKSIFLHRYKDFQPELRADCASNFGDWITADPTFFHDDDYLKYLGALMADREAIVRRQVNLESFKFYFHLFPLAFSSFDVYIVERDREFTFF